MRFRYFDSEGTEVGLSSVDALRFRIEKGVVTPETLLYDAAAGKWAPARQNPLFRFLVEEDENLLPEEHRALMDGSGTSARAAPESEMRTEPDTGPETPDPEPEISDERGKEESDPEGGAEAEFLDLSSMDPAGAEPDALDDDGFPAIELAPPESLSDSDPDSERDAGPGLDSDVESGSEREAETEPQWDDDGDWPSDVELGSGWPQGPVPRPQRPAERGTSESGAVREPRDPASTDAAPRKKRKSRTPTAAVDAPSRWSPPKSKMQFRQSGSRRRRPPSLVGVAALSVLMVLVVGIPLLILGGPGEGEDGSAYALVGNLAGDLVSGGPSEDPEEAPMPSANREGEGVVDGSEPATTSGPARLTPREIDALAADVGAAAAGGLEDALADLKRALDLPDRPPVEWLDARYLAAADSYPQVERYWVSFSTLVKSMEELEGELYRGFVQTRVLRMRLDTADAARLSARALSRYEQRAQDRASVYRDLSLLASNALALHDTLEARSDLIAYRPFEGSDLSRYPVMAAVPDDPVLAEHIWSRMSRTMDLLQSLDGARPESAAQIREAVRRTTVLATAGAAGVGGRGASDPSGPGELPTAADLPVPTQDLPDLD